MFFHVRSGTICDRCAYQEKSKRFCLKWGEQTKTKKRCSYFGLKETMIEDYKKQSKEED